ncbi:MAG: TapB family protein [Fimbriimonadales bacterium]
MPRHTFLLALLVVAAGCTAPTKSPDGPVAGDAAAKLESKETLPAELKTRALKFMGYPFEKPIRYKVTGLGTEAHEGGREITAEEPKNGKITITSAWTDGLATVLPDEVLVATKEGIRSTMIQGSKIEPPPLFLPADLKPGLAWKSTFRFERPGDKAKFQATTHWRIVGTEKVTVPLGTFDAIVVKESASIKGAAGKVEQIGKSWYTDGVGLVKAVHESVSSAPTGKPSKNTITITAIPAKG